MFEQTQGYFYAKFSSLCWLRCCYVWVYLIMKAIYLNEKISDILFKIHTHQEDANIRLASQAHSIAFFKFHPEIPIAYAKQFEKLIADIEKAQAFYIDKPIIYKFPYMHKTTAAKYIKLLMDIHRSLE